MNENIKSYCSRCDWETNHVVIFKHTVVEEFDKEDEDNEEIEKESKTGSIETLGAVGVALKDKDDRIHYMIVECCGCETVSFRLEKDWYMKYSDDRITLTDTFPESDNNDDYESIDEENDLPGRISLPYENTILAFNADAFLLAGIGIRSTIEAICNQESIEGKTLDKKIDNMKVRGLISDYDRKRLHTIRFLGNDAAHQSIEPDIEQLEIVLSIIDHILESLYIMDKRMNSNGLPVLISNSKEFTKLLNSKIRKLAKNQEYSLKDILGSDYRRIHENGEQLTQELTKLIQAGKYLKLSIGSVQKNSGKADKQMFILN